MAKNSGQKLKILYVAKYLLEESDEEHPVSVAALLSHLACQGIRAERKSIYDDLEQLRLFGLDVIRRTGKNGGYFIGERQFELPEVRLLVDAVQSSRFLTKKKSESLIRKLEGVLSRFEAKEISHHVYVSNRIKNMNESIYRNVDAISTAMENDKKIRFRYFEWGALGEKKFRRNGEEYVLSPFHLIWNEENYYLIGVEEKSGERRHFRVDKMIGLKEDEASRSSEELFRDFDPALYEKKTFGMFNGTEESVTLFVSDSIVGVFYDWFGQDLVTRSAEGGMETTVRVLVSPRFFAWLLGFGDHVKILAPDSVKEEYCRLMKNVLSQYKKGDAK